MEINKKSVIVYSLFALSLSPFTYAGKKDGPPLLTAKEIKNSKDPATSVPPIDETRIAQEEHELYELLYSDPSQNLAVKSPSIVMNAAQRLASYIVHGGVKSIPDPEYGNGTVQMYPIFSGGVPEAGGKRIVGQFEAIQSFVDYIFAASRGDGSASKMPLFVGPSGTGKTYFIGILAKIAETLTLQNPDHYVYSYEWIGLKKYPDLFPFLVLQEDAEKNIHEHPLPCPIHETPLNLLPQGLSQEVVKLASDRAAKLSHAKPNPPQNRCPHCEFIRAQILKSYMKENHLTSLTEEDEVDALAPHVRIKRIILGTKGTMARIESENLEPDVNGLYGGPNAINMVVYGPGHPMSYHLNGKILRANGGIIAFDEFFRNSEKLRDQNLNLFEEHTVRRGPEVKLDTVIVGASNYESIEKAKAGGSSKAQIDRTWRVRMPYLLNPYFEAMNLLNMKGIQNILSQPLNSEGNEQPDPQPANLDELFPISKMGEMALGPDGRFKLLVDTGPFSNRIHISPHTLMYIAMTVSASRLVMDPQKALKYGEKSVIVSAPFKDVYTRLQVLMKQYPGINSADLSDLRSLSRDLREGDEGISERDAANLWLTRSIEEAHTIGLRTGNYCLTPDLARKVFLKLMEEGALEYPDNKTRLRWTLISDEIMLKYLVPAIQDDVSAALGSGNGAVRSLYEEVFQELLALSENPKVTKYEGKNNEEHWINRERLEEIKESYRKKEGRDFSIGEIKNTHLRNSFSSEKFRHQGLERAIKTYLAKRSTDLITFDDIQRYTENFEGSSEVREKAGELGRVLSHEFGYCDHCMKSALMLTRQVLSRVEQL